jgi:hypothetical protein
MRKLSCIAIAAALFAIAGSASAQSAPFGTKGQFTLSAERVFGFHWNKVTVDPDDGPDHDDSGTTVGIGWAFAQPLQFNQARAGIDYFLTDGISLGAAVGFFAASGDMLDENGVIFYPRVGFSIPITQSIAFYPRVGPEVVSVGDATVFGIGGEANFVFLPRPEWGILLTPSLDLAPIGSYDPDGPDNGGDLGAYSIGISVGMLGIL